MLRRHRTLRQPRAASAGLRALGLGLGLCALIASGCRKHEVPTEPASPVVAAVGSVSLSVRDVEARLKQEPPRVRARYASEEQKQQFVEELVRFDVLAAEAERLDYERDPEVVRAMQQQAIAKLLEKEFDAKRHVGDVSDADVENYYRAHAAEFSQKEQRRALLVMVYDEAKAKRVAADAMALPRVAGANRKGFAELVRKYSEDEASRQNDGELPYFAADSGALAKPIVEAVFALAAVGDVSPLIASDGGFAIVMLTQRRPAFARPFADVKAELRQRLFREQRGPALEAFVASLMKKSKVELYPANIEKIAVSTLATNAEHRDH